MSDMPEVSRFCELEQVQNIIEKKHITPEDFLELSEFYHNIIRKTEVINCKFLEVGKTGGLFDDEYPLKNY